MFRSTPVVLNLIIINVLFFVAPYIFGLSNLANNIFGLSSFYSDNFRPWQLITYMFMHANFQHLLFNMLGLFIFGPMLEAALGAKRFIFFYFFCGIGAVLLYSGIRYYELGNLIADHNAYLQDPNPDAYVQFLKHHSEMFYKQNIESINQFANYPSNQALISQSIDIVNAVFQINIDGKMVGASGAIYGVTLGYGMLFPNTQLMLLFPPIPIKAKYMVGFYIAASLYGLFQANPNDNVAHLAHLGGMLFAYFLITYWRRNSQRFY